MGIRDRPVSPRSPWQNPYAERLIGTLRRDCLDHVLIFGERHLGRLLTLYSRYYNETRTHLGLGKDAPLRRAVRRSRPGPIRSASRVRAKPARPAPPAVVGAILDALRPLGIDHIDMPATPNRIRQALNALGTTKAAAE